MILCYTYIDQHIIFNNKPQTFEHQSSLQQGQRHTTIVKGSFRCLFDHMVTTLILLYFYNPNGNDDG